MKNAFCEDCAKEIVTEADEKTFFSDHRCEECFAKLCKYMAEADLSVRKDAAEAVNGSILDFPAYCDRCPKWRMGPQTVTQVEANDVTMLFCDKHLVDFVARVQKRFSLV